MRFTIDKEQKKFFRQNGWLQLEELCQTSERDALCKSAEAILLDYPGNKFERGRFISRSLPDLLPLIRRRAWGEIAGELCDTKKLLRLAYDHAFRNPTEEQKSHLFSILQAHEERCALLISFENQSLSSGIFFKESGFEHLYFTPNTWYLLLVFTSEFLNDNYHPVVTRR